MEENVSFEQWGDLNFEKQQRGDEKCPPMEENGGFEQWGELNFEKQQGGEEDEETLSLSDLPVTLGEEEKSETTRGVGDEEEEEEEEFNFGCWCNDVIESDMCTADQVFFQGQILPLRPSLTKPLNDQSSSDGLTSVSSRSNSIGSHNSSSTTSVTTTSSTTTTYKPKFRNRFHSHPSPKPQIISTTKLGNLGYHRKSTKWGIFKVGLIRTPEIELQELRNRSNKSFNSRSSSNSSSRKSDVELKSEEHQKKKKKEERSLFESCKCSVDAIETVIIVKKKNKKNVIVNENENEKKERKQALHHKRTFEWLKELSIADVPQEV